MRTKIEEYLNLDDREQKRKLLAAIAPLTGWYDVELTPRRLTRSGQQNRYYHSCVVKPFADFLRDQGESISNDEAHELLKNKWLRRTVINKASGEVIGETTRSTTSLDVSEMVQYLDSCINWLAEMFNIIVPDPHDNMKGTQ